MDAIIDRVQTAANSLQEHLDGVWQGREGMEAIIDSLKEAAYDLREFKKHLELGGMSVDQLEL